MIGANIGWIRHVQQVGAVGRETATGETMRPQRHWLIVSEHSSRGYQWLAETEQMLARGEWRIRHVNYENTPFGREVHSPSPYRWWLGIVTWGIELVTRRPTGRALEMAALWAGPLLQLILLAAGTVFVARRFDRTRAAVFAGGLAALFPLAGEFLPGVPNDHGLAIACAGSSVLLLVDGIRRGSQLSFIFSGVAGGLGLWVGVATQLPVLIAVAVGALLLAIWGKFQPSKTPLHPPLPWNSWALAGAATGLAAYLIEYFPRHLEMRLQTNHPIYGLTWIGLGMALTLVETWRMSGAKKRFGVGIMAVLALAALPVAKVLTDSSAFLIANPQASRLTYLPDGAVGGNLARWLMQDGQRLNVLATTLPFLVLVPAGLASLRRAADSASRASSVIAGSVVLASIAMASAQLQWWAMAQLGLIIFLLSTAPLLKPWIWSIAAGCLLPGIVLLAGTVRLRGEARLTRLEIEGLVERDIAHWIADHTAEDVVVLAAPERTPSLWFHGGLRGLGSPNWENRNGLMASVNILGATTTDEAQALLEQRGVTHILLPSWDTELDEFVRWTKNNPADTFLAALRRWALPPWVQPLAYSLPQIAGFESQSVLVFKITADTDRALSLSRLAEYALEMRDEALTSAVNDSLQAFPANLVALIGRAQIEKARQNTAAFDQIFGSIRQTLSNGLDRLLSWDRRLSLAIVLAQGGQNELARPPLQRCMAELSEARVRALSAGSLYRLLVLSKALDVPVTDPKLRELALALLPAEARARL